MMKKITIQLLFLFFTTLGFAQVLNQPANWPSTSWSITGSYFVSDGLFEGNPIINPNFAYDDFAAGSGTNNTLAAVSPVINLTPAYTAGETLINLQVSYTYNHQASDILAIQYYNATAGNWVNWMVLNSDTPGVGTDDYCSFTPVDLALQLDISSFTPTQLSGFRYRFYFNDSATWARGFCFSSPVLQSEAPPTCPDLSNIVLSNVTAGSVTATWTSGGNENDWEIVVQPTGSGVPTVSGLPISTNPYTYNGLSGSTNYEVYIRGNCGNGDFSNWVGPVTFTTLVAPPPAPVGINCGTGDSGVLYIEEFDTPAGWTGNISTGSSFWEIPDGSTSAGTGPATAYSGANFMNFEASSAVTPASIISPMIDLWGATGDIELSFYMYAYGAGMGTLNVGVGTSPTGPFTEMFTWTGQYQTNATSAWVPVGIDLSAYANQTIYVRFRQIPTTGSNNYQGDMSIDYLKVEACGAFCSDPSNISGVVNGNGIDLNWTANGGESNWQYVVQAPGSGVPTGSGIPIASNPYSIGGLDPLTEYEVYLRAACNNGAFSHWIGPYTFTTLNQTEYTVDCGVGPTNITYCYHNNDNTTYHFTSTTGYPLHLTFNAGQVQNLLDEMIVYDSDGVTQLYNGYGASGNLAGLNFTSSGDQIYVAINSNSSTSCANGNGTPWDFTVSCATCINPTVDYTIVGECQTDPNFTIQVNISDMGTASTLHIVDNKGNAPQNATAVGTYTFGPYSNGSEVMFTISNTNDASCTINSPLLEQPNCPSMSVSTSQYTPEQLITDVLINTYCSAASNVQWQGSSSFGTAFKSIGYFYDAYDFPITEGIILSTGDATKAPGPNGTGYQSDGTSSWSGDSDLVAITGESNIQNASFIEFDFVPQINHISFDYIFASEEYTQAWECTFSDVFAFILTDSQGNTSNLAVIPNTDIPVTVVNVHGGIGSCGPANEEYFDSYTTEGSGPINFNGYTVVLTAESDVIPGETYHLKLAIGDEGDSQMNSAVFLSAYSLNLGFCPPDNNLLCGATQLTPIPADQVGSVGYNAYQIETSYTEQEEPSGSCFANPAEGTIWFSFVAPPTGEVTINTYLPPSSPGIEYAVYDGNGTDCNHFSSLGAEVGCAASGVASIIFEGADALTPGNTYYIQINNPGNATSSLGIEVIYGDCIPPTFDAPVINPDCGNDQYYVDVNITTLGNGTPSITDGTTTWNITNTGIAHIGPFADESNVALTLEHGADAVCNINLGNYTYTCPYICVPVTAAATVSADCDNNQFYIDVDVTDLGNGTPVLTDGTGTWDITATGVIHLGPYADETNVTLAVSHGIDATCDLTLGTYTFNCPFICQPATIASATVSPDCDNNQFYVDVDITNMGNGTPTITNGTNSWIVTSTGVMHVGPFADESNVVLTLLHGIDDVCNVAIGNFTHDCPFVCSPATVASSTISPDCTNNQYYVDVNITALGNGTPAITDGTTTWNVTSTGIKHVGPFADESNVTLTLTHGVDATCDVALGDFTYTCPFVCMPTTYAAPTINPDCNNGNFYVSINITTLGNGTPTITDGTTVWNITSVGNKLIGPFTDGSSVALTLEHGIDTSCDIDLGNFTYTCPTPCVPATYASATVSPDCDNNQFYVDIDITDLGNGTPVVTDGVNTWNVTSLGVLHVGPFGNMFNVSLMLEHGNNATCDIDLGNFTYTCPEVCIPPTYASATVNPNCVNNQFYVNVFMTSLGNGSPVITDGTNSWNVTVLGMFQVGPFENGSTPTLTLEHGTNATCNVALGTFTYTCPVCVPPVYDSATIFPDCDNNQYYVSIHVSSIGNGVPVVTDGNLIYPVITPGTMLVGPYPSGSTATLTLEHGSDSNCNVDMGSFTYTCPFVCNAANYSTTVVNPDCDNNQFYVDINVTTLGNGTPSITDGTNTWPVTSTGVKHIGPFASGSSATLVLEHGIDSTCDNAIGTYTYTCPPPCEPVTFGTFDISPDCDNNQFYVSIDITGLGNGTPSITDGINTWPVTSTGVMLVGPFADSSSHTLIIEHGTNSACDDVPIGNFTYLCPIFICEPATFTITNITADCSNNQYYVNVNITGLGNGTPAITDGTTTWPVTSTGFIQVGPFANGSTPTLTLTHGIDAACDVTIGMFTYTCPFVCVPVTVTGTGSTFDCANNQFYVTLTISDLGNGNPVATDGVNSWPITSVGTSQYGPFPSGTPVVLTILHGIDSDCDLTLGSISYTCPPVNNSLCNPIALSVLDAPGNTPGDAYTVESANADSGEPVPSCFDGTISASVWFSFVAPASGEVTITTDIPGGTLGDTEIAVYNAAGVNCANATTLPAAAGCSQDGGITVTGSAVLTFDGTANPVLTAGEMYYVQVDPGYVTTTGTFGIEVIDLNPTKTAGAEKVNFRYYPNPVNNHILNLSANMPMNSVEVFNMLGQKVMNLTPETSTYTLDMHALAAGNYILKVRVGDTLQTVKILKE